jgi:hypothetical protein
LLTAFNLIIAIITAIPKVKELWDQLLAYYVSSKIDDLHEADREAIRKAVYEHDQRDLERQIGNPYPGERSLLPGTYVVHVDGTIIKLVQESEKKRDSSNHLDEQRPYDPTDMP